MSVALDRVLDLLLPRRALCLGCGSASGCREDWICPECRQALNQSWVGVARPPKRLDGASFAYRYLNPAAALVQRMKYSGVYRLTEFMGGDMAKAYRLLEPTGADCVTFVPMHPKRLRKRGYNQSTLLAKDVAGRLQLECVDALECVRHTPRQATLTDEERRRNLKDSFAPKLDLAGRRVLLVDDVCTTGSTARACAAALRAGGAERVYLVCYCLAREQK